MELLVGEVFRRNARVVPHRAAAALGDRRLTHAELDLATNRLAHALRARGVAYGDRILSWTDTCLDVLPLFAAAAKLGAVFAPMNARLGEAEASALARFARPRIVVADAAHAEAAEAVARASDIPSLAHLGRDRGGALPGIDLRREATQASEAEPRTPEVREHDPHVLFFTSGSTGRPKGVLLSHRVSRLRMTVTPPVARTLCMFPLFHMAGFSMALNAWGARGAIVFVERPMADVLLAEAQRHRVERLYCIPAVWRRVLDADPRQYDLGALRCADTGTSATPIDLIREIKEAFPATTTAVHYGSTECGPGAVLSDADVLRKPGSVGLPPPGVELALSPEAELLVSSDYLMSGYFENPEATAQALRDGWYRTGDLAALDDEGYVSIIGRAREVIRTGGETVAPVEVEGALADCPGVAEIAVVGIPDERWGEVVCAVVVPTREGKVTLADLRAHLQGRLAAYKQPRRLEIAASLPRTPATGQVQRTLLIEQISSTR